jgi:hypothetical protein
MRAARAWISEPARNRTREPMCHAKDRYRPVCCLPSRPNRARPRTLWLGQQPLPQRARSISNALSTGGSRRKKRARSAAIRSSWNRQLRRRAIPALHRLASIEHRAPPRCRSNSRPAQSFRGAHDYVPNRGRRRSRHWHAGSTPSGAFRREANLGEFSAPKVRHELHKSSCWLRIGQGAARLGSNPRAPPRRPGSGRSGRGPRSHRPWPRLP